MKRFLSLAIFVTMCMLASAQYLYDGYGHQIGRTGVNIFTTALAIRSAELVVTISMMAPVIRLDVSVVIISTTGTVIK